MRGWFSGLTKVAFRSEEAVSLWALAIIGGFRTGSFTRVMKRIAFATFTCLLALGGAIVGIFIGAIKGQTTETGFLNGAGIGALTGAIAAIQLLEPAAGGESLSKVALLGSLINGKVFMEWVCPAVLKAYQWQVRSLETSYREVSDIYDIGGVKGLSNNCIQKLSVHKFYSSKMIKSCHEFCCSICLQDFEDEDHVRTLPNCGHLFHLYCIDEWLTRQGTCPMCRKYVCNDKNGL
ncbi:NEP1-interacting protein-like 1 [Fagus crenata]